MLRVRLQYDCGTITVRSWYNYGTVMVLSKYAPSLLMVWHAQGLFAPDNLILSTSDPVLSINNGLGHANMAQLDSFSSVQIAPRQLS